MAQETMYSGLVNSPETTITNNVGVSDTLIYVLDPARVPSDLPNLMTIGTGTNAETVLVESINNSAITVQRGFQGVAKDWPAGTIIARNFTEYDHAAFKSNIEDLDTSVGPLANLLTTIKTSVVNAINSLKGEFTAHLAETATSQDLGHVKVDGTTITSDGGIISALSASVETVIASLPAHYERDIPWAKKSGSNTVLQSPSKMTVNINNSGYRITSQAELNLATASNWDTTSPTDYTTAANRAGKNFYVYACQPESGSTPVLKLSANSTVPSGYTASNSRKIAGFHCLCVAVGTISGHPLSGYVAGDILPASVWDLKHRPKCNPEGMVYSEAAEIWVDIYLQSGTGASTASVYGATITDTRNWMNFVDDGGAVKKQLLTDTEFQLIAAGSNEGTNISGSADPGTTGGHKDTNNRRMISNIGCEDCCGVMYQWLNEQSTRWDGGAVGWAWRDVTGGKGQLYLYTDAADVKLLAGSVWAAGAGSGSRSRNAGSYRWSAFSNVGCRLRAEPA